MPNGNPAFLIVVSGIIVAASVIEALVLSRKQRFDWAEMGISLLNFVARHLVLVFLPLSIATPLFAWAWKHRVATVPLNGWASFALLFVGQEFCYYWFHRASHRVRWFWANHSVHHSSNQMNLSASYRSAVFGKLAGDAVFFVPLALLGFHPKAVLAALALNLLYQTWVHVTWVPRLGWLEWVFNTPSAHRVHHAANPEYLDANFGGVLIVFDRLFGTYVEERADVPCRYGLVQPETSRNPLRVEFGRWRELFADLSRARGVRGVLGCLFMPPGWQPGGASQAVQAAPKDAT